MTISAPNARSVVGVRGLRGRLMSGTVLAGTAVVLMAAGTMGDARAAEFRFDDWTVTFDTTVSTGISARVSQQEDKLIADTNGGTGGSVNGDNGNLNYSKGDITSFNAKATHEIDISYGRDWGVFGRTNYFYDWGVMGGDPDRTGLGASAREGAGRDVELLDAYIYGSFDAGNVPVSIKLGQQVISWGESTFIQNGINTINPVDVAAFRTAGAEVRDGLLPVPAVDVTASITDNLSVEGFWQLGWYQTEIDASGTFFSTNDFISPGGRNVLLSSSDCNDLTGGLAATGSATSLANVLGCSVARADDRGAKDWNQFGLAVRYFAEELNDTEFGIYAMNYNSRLPLISANASDGTFTGFGTVSPTANYYAEYPNNIRLYGASFNTDIAGIAFQGEFSYREDQPLQIDDNELLLAAASPSAGAILGFLGAAGAGAAGAVSSSQLGLASADTDIPGYRRKDVIQAQLTMTNLLGPTLGADDVAIVNEIGGTWIPNLESIDELRYEGPNTVRSGNSALANAGTFQVQNGFATSFSAGWRGRIQGTFNNAVGPINLRPSFAWGYDFNGITPQPLGNFVDGRAQLTFGLEADYLNAIRARFSYTNSFGGGFSNVTSDRDFVSLSFSYSF